MALLTPLTKPWRRSEFDATERSLLSPLEMRRPLNRAVYWGVFLILLLLTLSTLFPLFWLFSGALKTPREFFKVPPTLFPSTFYWTSYVKAWETINFPRAFFNTMVIAFGGWLTQMAATCMAAFALSKLRPFGSRVIMYLLYSTMLVPGATLLIPRYLSVVEMPIFHVSLMNNYLGLWLPGAPNAFGIFILKTFFDNTIPSDLTDAARIDGASATQMFLRIVLPLSKAAIVVLTIGVVMAAWQEFLWPMLVLQQRQDLWPIMTRIGTFAASGNKYGSVPMNVVIAANAIAAIPPLILFLFFQKQIIRGVNLTGLQG
jgi:multiple sugar transport system permease protein